MRRGARNGLRWAHLIACLAMGMAGLGLSVGIVDLLLIREVAPLHDGRLGQLLWQLVGVFVGFYATICLWGVILGSIAGLIVYALHRRAA